MSEPWVFLEDLTAVGSHVLAADEARHVAARRLRLGDSLVVFDGQGRTADAQIESLGKNSTVISVDTTTNVARPEANFVLASAIPKGDRLSTMLQMLTQLGLGIWQPLVLEDSVVRKLDPTSSRLKRILLESCKVSRRPWLLDVRSVCSLEDLLEKQPGDAKIYFGDREGPATGFGAGADLAVVGPEAGFSEAERRALLDAGALPRSFGAHNLRIETAAVAAAVALHLGRAGAALGSARE